ncbi:MAG: helix-turn-helix domain-containing protein [Phenylobacterium sp.]|uniref:arsenate reductase/protein-tyrosine-phosphatase family protein n=1 Tax=Phenylobacterium sp. TaxID=1871053 RepID=UPI001A4A4F3D|nr:helix-turn-helix domain-containing protein [Phenylobacterium sp.]MBL8771195.1 helix-turn-helix domain-containing protein [Phenylobacterium sp.]
MALRQSLEMSPPPFLQLAAHPLRWRLLEELGRGDRTVQELTERVGEPQNLVSYHLGKLRAGELVSARRSAADGRDMYYRLHLDRVGGQLSTAGAALHPGLRLAPRVPADGYTRSGRVLFLCTGNSARSQMAEALLRVRSGGRIEAESAGSQPRPLHPNAVRVMREDFGIDISGQAPKPIADVAGRRFDSVISLCDRVREACAQLPGRPETQHWSLPNPATGGADAATYPLFRHVADELSNRISFLLAAFAEPAAA